MTWKFWQGSAPRVLSEGVQQALRSQFKMDAETTDRMRVLRKDGRYAGRRVQFLKVYDPTLIKDGQATSLKFDQFLKNQAHRSALLFEGHTEKDGSIHLTDRRPSKAGAQAA